MCAVAFLLISFVCISGTAEAVPVPGVKKDRIINKKTGRQFIPRGVNWPSFEYACVDGWGYSHAATGKAGVKAMKRWRINTVRIPLNQDCWLGVDGLPRGRLTARKYRKAVVRFIKNLNRQGIVAVPVLHWSGGKGVSATGLRAMPDDQSVKFWRSLAKTLRSRKGVMFDAFNEPYSRWNDRQGKWAFELSWGCWANGGCYPPISSDQQNVGRKTFKAVGMRKLVQTIRKAKAKQPIILSGSDYGNDLSGWADAAPNDRQLIAGLHTYRHQECFYESCWDERVSGLRGKAPILATEIGQTDCQADHMKKFVRWADRKQIGYLAWAWWAIPEGCANFALIQNWKGKPQHAYGRFYRNHLQNKKNFR